MVGLKSRLEPAHGGTLRAQKQRARRQRPAGVADAGQQAAVGDAGRCEDGVTAHEVAHVEDAAIGRSSFAVDEEPGQCAAEALQSNSAEDRFRGAADAKAKIDGTAWQAKAGSGRDVALIEEDPTAGLTQLVDEVAMARTIENADAKLAARQRATVSRSEREPVFPPCGSRSAA